VSDDNITYVSEIVYALTVLNGMGSLKEINNTIETHGILPAISRNPNWQANVRAEIQKHCSATKSYNGGSDLFYSVYGLGEGYWGLKSFLSDDDLDNPIIQREIHKIQSQDIAQTEKAMLIKARIGQGIFRDSLIKKYGACIVTGISDRQLLLASHIKPWRSANNQERLSVENGLLLSPLYDRLFDSGLISFNKQMKIIISGSLPKADVAKMRIDTDTSFIRSPSIELMRNMEYHNDKIFRR